MPADLQIKAITVRQPWAWAIARGWKPIENRSWTTTYRGPLAIHAGQLWDGEGLTALRLIVHTLRGLGESVPKRLADDMPWSGTGCVLAVGRLAGVCAATVDGHEHRSHQVCECGPWAIAGQYHWQLTDVRPLAEPLPATGRLGLWPLAIPTDRLAPAGEVSDAG